MLPDMFLHQSCDKKNIWTVDLKKKPQTLVPVCGFALYIQQETQRIFETAQFHLLCLSDLLWHTVTAELICTITRWCTIFYCVHKLYSYSKAANIQLWWIHRVKAVTLTSHRHSATRFSLAVNTVFACRLTSSSPGEDFDACRWGVGWGAEDTTEA